MDKQLHFSKTDIDASWGFRLVGGSDFNQPLLVVKVNENSLAEQCGLEVGDLILSINDSPTVGLTHSEVHDFITSSGLNFTLGIRRGIVPIEIIHEGELSFEFQDFLKGIQTSIEEDIFAQAADIVEKLNEENLRRNKEPSVNKQKKMVFSNATQTQLSLEDEEKTNKFSTFMMKPDKPIPKPKRKKEEPKPDQESYKVVIKRQASGRKYFKEKKVQFDQNITEMEIEARSETTEDNSQEIVDETEENNGEASDLLSIEEIHEEYEENIDHDNNNHYETEDYAEENGAEENEEQPLEIKYKPLSEIRVDSSSELSMTLEEQLLAVQKQLQALSQLPSAIQMTLDAVSKQLASIVSAKEDSEEKDKREENHENGTEDGSDEDRGCIEETSEDEARAETTQELNGGSDSSLDGDFDDDSIAEEEIEAILKRARLEEGGETEVEEEQVEEISEEERQAQIKEQEMLAKKEKDRVARPIQRPIILPGGRKWSNPEDAMPTFRKPRMSEEKIIETIEGSLEPIAGKRKGINFLKYQPPPKNLDYLQRSEVYRLVHDMEPPVRGIVSRPEKVLPEQDYYEASKEAS
ncbi:unnamed protein product [Phaedon cochleariae]|uniref:PDZ domain-containing protein n=1 Tax=Phaedon cochleariae TaxID=80249 RepID=A0A9N9SKD9_PHACE|nr:unnamed protein product [Phaedon cochleariae]